jgi:hypothetical protein
VYSFRYVPCASSPSLHDRLATIPHATTFSQIRSSWPLCSLHVAARDGCGLMRRLGRFATLLLEAAMAPQPVGVGDYRSEELRLRLENCWAISGLLLGWTVIKRAPVIVIFFYLVSPLAPPCCARRTSRSLGQNSVGRS